MGNAKRVTIKEVAEAAGVSTQTVSRVINEHPDVADGTRQQVSAVIERLGYRPSALARSLIRQRSRTLGVVTAGLQYIGPSRILNGVADQATREGYHLLLKQLPGFDTTNVKRLLDELLEHHVEGVIWAVPEIGDNQRWLHERLPDLDVPIVFLATEQQPGKAAVLIDNYSGGRLATEHLLEQGYRHIAHLAGPLAWWAARERKAGWEAALATAGLAPDASHCVEGNWSSRSAERAIERLLAQYPQMDAVFVANDQMALSVLHVAHRHGIRVPEELGVVGFDGLPESAYFWPPLTTVDQDQHELGCHAVQELVKMIGATRTGEPVATTAHLVFQPRLIQRRSSARLAAAA